MEKKVHRSSSSKQTQCWNKHCLSKNCNTKISVANFSAPNEPAIGNKRDEILIVWIEERGEYLVDKLMF